MSYQVDIIGMASKSILISFSYQSLLKQRNLDLMSFLRQNGVTIASSCYAEGICKKCLILCDGFEKLSCQIPLDELIKKNIKTIEISYL